MTVGAIGKRTMNGGGIGEGQGIATLTARGMSRRVRRPSVGKNRGIMA